MNEPPLRIGLAGLGTVGSGVVKMIQKHEKMLSSRGGRPVVITAVSARDRQRNRPVDISSYAWVDNAVDLASRDDVDCIIEVMGGSDGPAKATVEAALNAGKHVVTANKALLAHHGQTLAQQAETSKVSLRYEAAVAGGIPIIKALGEGLAGNKISCIYGVLNGTCNYILTQMEKTGQNYNDILLEAQHLGYAEADPTADVGGFDTAHKLALLAALGFGCQVNFADVDISGIETVSLEDIRFAGDLGYRIKLLGIARMTPEGLMQQVSPCLIAANSAIGLLDGVTNAVMCKGDFVGQTVYQGPGAGEGPTASAILGDVIDIARGCTMPSFGIPAADLSKIPCASPDQQSSAYYLRLTLKDESGVFAKIAAILGNHDISIDQLHQSTNAEGLATALIVTHECRKSSLDQSIAQIIRLEINQAPPVMFAIAQT